MELALLQVFSKAVSRNSCRKSVKSFSSPGPKGGVCCGNWVGFIL